MSETVYEMIEGRPLRIVQIVLYIGGAPVVTDLTTSPDERALVMTYLRGEAGTGGGGAGVSYSFASALQWTVNHNLGYRPAVEVMNNGGEEIEAEVLHISVNQCRVTFNTPTAGRVSILPITQADYDLIGVPDVDVLYVIVETAPSGAALQWEQLTQAEYDAIGTPDPDTLYVVVG